MKQFSSIVLACALAIPALAQDAKTNAVAELNKPAAADVQAPGQSFLASAAVLTAPLVLTNDYIVLAADQRKSRAVARRFSISPSRTPGIM